MIHKQAKRRKQKKTQKWKFPYKETINLVKFLVALTVIFFIFQFGSQALDWPIETISIESTFERVDILQIEEIISSELNHGFFSINLSIVKERVASLPWIDKVLVSRRWPGKLEISVTEQIPVARWGDSGLLNIHGELFVKEARHISSELPLLNGPEDRSYEIAQRFISIQQRLIPFGLDLRGMNLDERGAWEMTLSNGISIRIGRRNISEKFDFFINVVANFILSQDTAISFIDMRYDNGFSVSHKK